MKKTLFQLTEISIVLAANQHNPTILNQDFLKFNRIVPDDWTLKQPPICVFPVAQVEFNNGINIIAQPETVTFREQLRADPSEILLPSIVKKYVETVPHVPYTGVGINPHGHIEFKNREEAVEFINDTFISPSAWPEHRDALRDSRVTFSWQLENILFSLNINNSLFQSKQHVVLFSSNMHHRLEGLEKTEGLSKLNEILDSWRNDVKIFTSFLDELNISQSKG